MASPPTNLPDSFPRHALHIVALSAVAIAQPLFDIVARGGEFLVAHRAGATDLFALLIALMVLIPAVPVAGAWLAGLVSGRLQQLLVALTIFGLIALETLQVVKTLGASSAVFTFGSAAVTAAIGTGLYWRTAIVRSFTSVLGIGILVIPGVFLFQDSIAELWRWESAVTVRAAPAPVSAPIVMVVFDQFPLVSLLDERGEIDAGLYPSLAALARQSTWFRGATGVSDRTHHALPAILTGNYPRPNTLPGVSDHPNNLFTWLANYELHVLEPITALCPPDLCGRSLASMASRVQAMLGDLAAVYLHIVSPREIEGRLPPVNQHWRDFERPMWLRLWQARRGEDRRSAFQQFIEQIETGADRPTLHFAHVLLPHEPYMYYPSGRTFDTPDNPVFGLTSTERWTSDPWPVAHNYQRELQQVRLVDRLIGSLIDRLKRIGLYDPALIVVTADHGASFRSNQNLKVPGDGNYADIMSVPLLVKAPSQSSGQVDDRNIETIDILPTMADLLGVRVPWPTDGVSGLRGSRGDEKRIYYNESNLMLARSLEDVVRGREEAVRLKLNLFGSPADPDRVVGLGSAARVLGQSTDAMPRRQDERFDVSLDARSQRASAAREPDFLPGVLSGVAYAELDRDGRPELAIAVDGTVRAVARVHYPSVGPPVWAALLPESAIEEGANRVEIFEILEDPDGRLALRETGAVSELGGFANLLAPTVDDERQVEASGFYDEEYLNGVAYRWTAGVAHLRFQVDPGHPLERLAIRVAQGGPPDRSLRITLDDCVVYRGPAPGSRWRRTFPVEECAVDGPTAVIEFVTDEFVPGPQDRRSLGIALEYVGLAE